MKKIPKLASLLHRERKSEPQTPQQMKSIVKMLNAAFGGSVVKRKKKG